MDHVNFSKDLFESLSDYRKTVLIVFSIKNDVDCRSLKIDFICLCLEFKNISLQQNEEYLDYFKNEEESINGRILEK